MIVVRLVIGVGGVYEMCMYLALSRVLGGWSGVMSVCVVSLDYFWRWRFKYVCIVFGVYLNILLHIFR